LPQHELEVPEDTGSFEDEGWRVRKDGSLFWANVVITAMRESRGRSRILPVMIRLRSSRSSIRVTSRGEGEGSTFFVELPISIVQLEDEQAQRTHPTAQVDPGESVELPGLVGVNAFIIDDEPDARELLQRVFENQGAQVTSFATTQDALLALRTTRPAVIVSDIGMPHMDGYQFMRALRANEPRNQRIPALALTAFARAEDRKSSLLAGYQGHLAKPFDVAELILVVAGLVGR
jgi:CheY-like chemotaxis protein